MHQGGDLSPTIYKMVVDSVLWNWLSMVVEAERESGPEGFVRDIQRM